MDHNASFGYDTLNRLNTASATGSQSYNLGFQSDQWGNTDCPSGGSGYCADWSFDTSKNRINSSGFDYDAAGNTTGDGTGAGTNDYAWDGEGRMKTVTPYGSSTTNFLYNALGQRVEKYTRSAYTEIAYDAFGNQIGTHNQTTWGTYFVPLGGRTLVRYQDNKTYFLHPNHLGSTAFVTDQTGATIQKTIYYPWGQTWQSSATVKDSRFASMDPRDNETANDPTLFRMYQPRLYRWLSPDPLAGDISNPQSLNRYAYVLNNPCGMIDPLGLNADCTLKIAFRDKTGQSGEDLTLISNQIMAVFAATTGQNGESIAASFEFAGNPDYTLTLSNKKPASSSVLGQTWPIRVFGWGVTAYVNRIENKFPAYSSAVNRTIGVVGAHEIAHAAGVQDEPYNSQVPANIMTAEDPNLLPNLAKTALPSNALFTPAQVSAVYAKCTEKHGPNPAVAGNTGLWNPWIRWWALTFIGNIAGRRGGPTEDDGEGFRVVD